jgi:DNA polymerase-3 subunit chi
MPEVSFYLLPDESTQNRFLYACKLIEKAYRSGHFCYVVTDTDEHSQLIDDLLWTFRAGSFVPHQIYSSAEPDYDQVILIGHRDIPEHWLKTVVNLSNQCPAHFERAERILEVLDASEAAKETGRNRYRQYQQSGMTIKTHKINA